MDALCDLRRQLHAAPELSGAEAGTASKIASFIGQLQPDAVIERIGGTGLAFVYDGRRAGRTLLLRCELDALPIHEQNDFAHASRVEGVAHKCGHDGHMAILAGVAASLSSKRPDRGRVVLLFQPAEETGQGASAVLEDPRFLSLQPDAAFALHNLPGFKFGQIVVRSGTMCCASRGILIELSGRSAHAAQPETGNSPAKVMAQLILDLDGGTFGQRQHSQHCFATVVGASLGEKAFGTAPSKAVVMATLRCETDQEMEELMKRIENTAGQRAADNQLELAVSYEDVFPATVNSEDAVAMVRKTAEASFRAVDSPFRWSEDFGRFTARYGGALIGLGAGLTTPQLHCPDYDFPDNLIPIGVDLLSALTFEFLK